MTFSRALGIKFRNSTAQPDNANADSSAAGPSTVALPPVTDKVAHQKQLAASSKSSAFQLFSKPLWNDTPSLELNPLPSPTPSPPKTRLPRSSRTINLNLNDSRKFWFQKLPMELTAAIINDTEMSAFDIVALAQATGMKSHVVLNNYLGQSSQKKQEFILANAPFMKESEILNCITRLKPEERPAVLLSLSPFIRSQAGKTTLGRHIQNVQVPTPFIGNQEEYLKQNHGAKQESVLGALRSNVDLISVIKNIPAELRTNATWLMNLRQLEVEMRALDNLDLDGQLNLKMKVAAFNKSEPAGFEGYTDGLSQSLRAHWKTIPVEARALELVKADILSTRDKISTAEPAEQTEHLQDLLTDLVATPHSPVLQKKIVRLVKDFCKKDDTPEENRVALLKKLSEMGPELHAAPTYDLRAGYNVQGYAYKLFKHELGRLSPAAKAEVAIHWAKENARWDTAYRPFSKTHWKNIGYAAGTVALVGGASGGIAVAATLPAVAASAGAAAAIGSVVAKSAAVSGAVGIIAGGAAGLMGGVPDLAISATTGVSGTTVGAGTAFAMDTGFMAPASTLVGGSIAGGIGAGLTAGFATGYVSGKISKLAKQAVVDAGGIQAVAIKLRKNPISSIQTAVQRTASGVFSFDSLSDNLAKRAEEVQVLGPHFLDWVEATATFPEARQTKLRADLAKLFDLNNYRPEDRADINTAIASARDALVLTTT